MDEKCNVHGAEWTMLELIDRIESNKVKFRKGLFRLREVTQAEECTDTVARYGQFTVVVFEDKRVIKINQTIEEFHALLEKESRGKRKCDDIDLETNDKEKE